MLTSEISVVNFSTNFTSVYFKGQSPNFLFTFTFTTTRNRDIVIVQIFFFFFNFKLAPEVSGFEVHGSMKSLKWSHYQVARITLCNHSKSKKRKMKGKTQLVKISLRCLQCNRYNKILSKNRFKESATLIYRLYFGFFEVFLRGFPFNLIY